MDSPTKSIVSKGLDGIIGLVLAGGKSSRMGKDKSRIVLNQNTLLQHAQLLFKRTGLHRVLISSNQLEDAIPDKISGCGPLSAIHSLANEQSAKTQCGMIVLPVDMPLLTVSLIETLCKQGKQGNVACFYEGNPLPAFIPINASLNAMLEQQINSDDFSIKTLLKRLNAKSLIVPNKIASDYELSPFFNLNTPHDWETLVRKAEQALLS